MNDDQITLASAYLDGVATADERAQVEGDEALLGEVERLRQVRAVLGVDADTDDTLAAPISTRERHLAAALDAYDRRPTTELIGDLTPTGADAAAVAGTASMTAPTSLSERRSRHRFSSKIMTAAAAVVILAGAGLVVRSVVTSNDDGDVNVALDAGEADVADDLTASAELEATPEAAAEETFSDDAPASDDDVAVVAPVADADSEGVQGGSDQARPEDEGLEVLSSTDDLAVFATGYVLEKQAREASEDASVSAQAPAGEAPADDVDGASEADAAAPVETFEAVAPLCGLVDDIIGFALWDTDGLFDEAVVVGVDNSTGDVVAYTAEDCVEVARTPLPQL